MTPQPRPVMLADRKHIDHFQRIYYDTGRDFDLHYHGVPCVKCPLDLAMYHEVIWETRPELIVETGAFLGGSTLWLAHQLDLIGGEGRVLSVELETERPLPEHPRIDFILGMSSTAPAALAHVRKHADGKRTMVILDSDHSEEHVLDELNHYASLVTKGCYLVVEDTNPHAYTGPAGPERAVKKFQPTNKGFEVDRRRERMLMTCHPGGWLRRVR